ncbi:MAG: hypothetical protein ACI81G_001666, partial [Gammaproteobacteria bacterium]
SMSNAILVELILKNLNLNEDIYFDQWIEIYQLNILMNY